jgi:phosphoribosylformimino-5-aminoimidazole carboxamide ribotide isomerase
VIAWVAVDILEGRAVRLRQGRREERTDYGPAADAVRRWAGGGAKHFHLVDLGAAFGGAPALPDLLPDVRASFPDAVLQVAGGIRDLASAERLMDRGADRVVVGSALYLDPDGARAIVESVGAGRCVAALDTLDGTVRVKGWTEGTGESVELALARAAHLGFGEALVTDIARDGLLSSPNVELYRRLGVCRLPLVASGGVTSRQHLDELRSLPAVVGAVVGKALYEGRLGLEDLLEAAP